MIADFTVRRVQDSDRAAWQALYAGYARFYQTTLTEQIADTVWQWLMDDSHALIALVCCHDDALAGLVHLRACPHPLKGQEIGFVDDLYVAENVRGQGAADALVEGVRRYAETAGWPRLRWVTQDHNARGRALYDRYTGGPSEFILYNWAL